MKKQEVHQDVPKMEEYTQHMFEAYEWYTALKTKEGKTPSDLSYILEVEELHKITIIRMYQQFLISGNAPLKKINNAKVKK